MIDMRKIKVGSIVYTQQGVPLRVVDLKPMFAKRGEIEVERVGEGIYFPMRKKDLFHSISDVIDHLQREIRARQASVALEIDSALRLADTLIALTDELNKDKKP